MAQHFHIPPPVLCRMSLAEVLALLGQESPVEQFKRRSGMTPERALERAEAVFAKIDAASPDGGKPSKPETSEGMVDRLVGKIAAKRKRKARARMKGARHGD